MNFGSKSSFHSTVMKQNTCLTLTKWLLQIHKENVQQSNKLTKVQYHVYDHVPIHVYLQGERARKRRRGGGIQRCRKLWLRKGEKAREGSEQV